MNNPYFSKEPTVGISSADPAATIILGNSETVGGSQRSLIFGEMVKRARVLTTHYHSDLYHDAQWLDNFVHGEQSWFWTVRPSGTYIGEDHAIPSYAAREPHSITYQITLTQSPRTDMWTATFAPIGERAPQ